MFPFDNKFVTFEMSGEEIIRTLKTINRRIIYPSSGLIQVYRKSNENNILVDAKVFASERTAEHPRRESAPRDVQ